MPAKKYDEPVRLSQRWPKWLLEAVATAAEEKGQNSTQWLQEVAKASLTRQWSVRKQIETQTAKRREREG